MASGRMRLKWGLKRLEGRIRNLRARVETKARRRSERLVENRLVRAPVGAGPWAWLDIQALDFDGPQGRLVYSLFVMFERAGFNIAFRPNRAFISTFEKRPIKQLLLKRDFPLVEDPALLPDGYWWVTDRGSSEPQARAPGKIIRLLRFAPLEPGAEDFFALPFSLFPPHYESGADGHVGDYRGVAKNWRLFFGGGTGGRAYDKAGGARIYGTVPRGRLIGLLKAHLGDRRLVVIDNAAQLAKMRSGYFPGAVLVETSKLKVPVEEWLSMVAASECFLAAPGVNRPMSHNIIEAMAVGVPALTEYGDQFHPGLRDGVDCLAYRGEQGFVKRLDDLLGMDPLAMARLGLGATAYYDQHLRYDSFVAKLAAHPGRSLRLHIAPHEQPAVVGR